MIFHNTHTTTESQALTDSEERHRSDNFLLLLPSFPVTWREMPSSNFVGGGGAVAGGHFLERHFRLSERGTDVATEVRAGIASFLTLSYLLLVNPKIMAQAGVDHDDAVFATALSASISCLIIGIFGNLPFGTAPGLGLSAYLAFGLVQAELCTLSQALSACWWSGIFVLIVSLSGGTTLLMKTVPQKPSNWPLSWAWDC
jgi:hypothetical protein